MATTATTLSQEQISVFIDIMNLYVELYQISGNSAFDKFINDHAIVVEGVTDDNNRVFRDIMKISQGTVGLVNSAGQVLGNDYYDFLLYEDITVLNEKAAQLRLIHRNQKFVNYIFNKINIADMVSMEATMKSIMNESYSQKMLKDLAIDLDQTIRNDGYEKLEAGQTTNIFGTERPYRTSAGTVLYKNINTVAGAVSEATIDAGEALMYAQIGPKNQEIEWSGAKFAVVNNAIAPTVKKIVHPDKYTNQNYKNLIMDCEVIPAKLTANKGFFFDSNPTFRKVVEANSRGWYQGQGNEGQLNLFLAEIYNFTFTSGFGTYVIDPN